MVIPETIDDHQGNFFGSSSWSLSTMGADVSAVEENACTVCIFLQGNIEITSSVIPII